MQTLQIQHQTLQAELSASRDVLAAREREVDLLGQRVEEAEREVGILRDELGQAQVRIETLLEMGQGSEDGLGVARSEEGSSEEASMAFDKVCGSGPGR
jgi:chromosome segregation ATPase